ncbi:MAG: hypoxanthine phosphoribosyltransferase [Defluviitaleaceae bacterium]|nr:hypoxanthine phosphoribosyltransferase [Defluviitaleaceae bacterium]
MNTSHKIRELISAETIAARVDEMAQEICQEFNGEEITAVCLLKGAVVFMSQLVMRIPNDMTIDFLDISSYHDGTSASVLKINSVLGRSLAGKNILVIEDIIDSGYTLDYVYNYLKEHLPAKLKLAMLLDKPSRRATTGVEPDYIGFTIPDEFVVGYGMDYAEKYRNLPFIGVIEKIEEGTEK